MCGKCDVYMLNSGDGADGQSCGWVILMFFWLNSVDSLGFYWFNFERLADVLERKGLYCYIITG